MRKIQFKALNKNNDWIFGVPSVDLTHVFNENNINSFDNYEVIKDTLCQNTGVKDSGGREIFENDILKWNENEYVVVYLRGSFVCMHKITLRNYDLPITAKKSEIIGNIHEKSI